MHKGPARLRLSQIAYTSNPTGLKSLNARQTEPRTNTCALPMRTSVTLKPTILVGRRCQCPLSGSDGSAYAYWRGLDQLWSGREPLRLCCNGAGDALTFCQDQGPDLLNINTISIIQSHKAPDAVAIAFPSTAFPRNRMNQSLSLPLLSRECCR